MKPESVTISANGKRGAGRVALSVAGFRQGPRLEADPGRG